MFQPNRKFNERIPDDRRIINYSATSKKSQMGSSSHSLLPIHSIYSRRYSSYFRWALVSLLFERLCRKDAQKQQDAGTGIMRRVEQLQTTRLTSTTFVRQLYKISYGLRYEYNFHTIRRYTYVFASASVLTLGTKWRRPAVTQSSISMRAQPSLSVLQKITHSITICR